MTSFACSEIPQKPHHIRGDLCGSRAKYRDGRRGTAVKVYTINQESRYILIQGVPAVGAHDELKHLCEQYGVVEKLRVLDEYPSEDFTETYLIKYQWFPAARTAKKHLDDNAFFGGTLHLCYAPEFETAQETRQKLQDRRKYVSFKSKGSSSTPSHISASKGQNNVNPQPTNHKRIPILNQTPVDISQPVTYIWAGKEYTVYPSTISANKSNEDQVLPVKKSAPLIPRPVARSKPQNSTRNPPTTLVNANIRQKLLDVSVPNLSVNIVRKRKCPEN